MHKDARTVFMSLFWDDFNHLLKYALIICALCALATISLLFALIFQPQQRIFVITTIVLCILALVGNFSYGVYQCAFYYQRMYDDQAFFFNSVPLSITEIIKEKFCVIAAMQLCLQIVVFLFGMLLYSALCYKAPYEMNAVIRVIQGEVPMLGFTTLGNVLVFVTFCLGNAVCTACLIIGTVTIGRLGFLRKFPILGCIVGFIIVLLIVYALGVLVSCFPVTANVPVVSTEEEAFKSFQAIGNAYLSFGNLDILQVFSSASLSSSAIYIIDDGTNLINRAPMGGVILEPFVYMACSYFLARLAQRTYQASR